MKILHIAAHLGGGVGKAHSGLTAASDRRIARHYVLLEPPRDRRYADQVEAAGAVLTIAPGAGELADLAAAADIVQIEWWNHPRLYDILCRTSFPAMRTIVWCHISGLFAPLIPKDLYGAGHRFLFTSDCSFEAADIAALPLETLSRLSTIGSGYGFAPGSDMAAAAAHSKEIAYLGTLDFAKMSPRFFDVIDAVESDEVRVSLWGNYDKDGEVLRAARAMMHPHRVVFMGHAADPQTVLQGCGIFLYLLQPEHYGTAENALLEAMSLGCVPLAFDNPAERRIVEHSVTGFLERDVRSAAKRLDWMLRHPAELARIGADAMAAMAKTRTAQASARQFHDLYETVCLEEKRVIDFKPLLGETAAHWFLSTQVHDDVLEEDIPARIGSFSAAGAEAKGSLAHFRSALPDDRSLWP